MAEMADAILNGDFDCITGEWLGNGYGVPRTRQITGRKKNRDWVNIKNYLSRFASVKNGEDCVKVVLKYSESKKMGEKDIKKLSAIIQQDFSKFSNWCRSNIQ